MSDTKTPDLRIEPGTIEDVPAIVHMLLRAVPNCIPLSFDQVAQNVSDMFVAKDEEGELVATVTLSPVDTEHIELRSVVVDESLRGTGVGRAFIEKVIDEHIGEGRRVCCATRNRGFFESLGFRPIDTAWETGGSEPPSRERLSMILDPEEQKTERAQP